MRVTAAPVVVVGVDHEGELLLAAHGDGLLRAHEALTLRFITRNVTSNLLIYNLSTAYATLCSAFP